MDIKLKNYRYSVWLKLLAIILCVAGMITLAYGLLKAPYFEDAIQNKEFKESITGKNIFRNAYSEVSTVAFNYKSEDNIMSGAALDQQEIRNAKYYYENERQNELQQADHDFYNSINQYQDYIKDQPIIIDADGNVHENTDVISDIQNKEIQDKIKAARDKKNTEIQEINDKYDKYISEIQKDLITQQLENYKSKISYLNNLKGIYYSVAQNGKTILSNVTENNSMENHFNTLPFSVKLTQNNWNQYFGYNSYTQYYIPADTVVYLGMSPERYQTEVTVFEKNSNNGLTGIKTSAIGLLTFLIGLIYLIYSAGRRYDKEGVHLIAVDIIYLDIALVVSVGAIALCFAPIVEFLPHFYRDNLQFNTSVIYSIFGTIIAMGTLIGILFVTMFIKRLKRHEVIKHTLLYKLLNWTFIRLKNFYLRIKTNLGGIFDKSPLAVKLVLIFCAYAVLTLISASMLVSGDAAISFFGFLAILVINVFAIYYILKNFKAFINIRDGAERIRAGELSYNIPELGFPEISSLAESVNKIADGLKNAVSSQVKAERMKAELITNVSHDLKTPLTSIITYVDLLKNEGLNSENAEKYLGIIDSKSQRLKSLTEDLFEAAKATSGNITVNNEKLNVASLISQGLGELSDKIEASGLTFRTSFPPENIYVNADGRLLWRVIENLLSNVFKYALPNSRVYIDVEQTNEKVKIIVKNISAYELNVNEDELMERFKRGDASRHSEGSGLGLSIAKSLTELQGGHFSIKIDGDLFKAVVELPLVSE